jgi:flavorubredoxin
VVIIYDSMWGSTENLAKSILRGLIEKGVEVKVLHLRSNHRSDIVEEMLEAKGILLGSPTLNNGMFPTLGDFLTYIKGLRPHGKVFGLFESYGWGGGALKEMRKNLEEVKFEVWEKELRAQFLPDPGESTNAIQFGRDFADRVFGG